MNSSNGSSNNDTGTSIGGLTDKERDKDKFSDRPGLSQHDQRDAMMCEAIRKACVDIDLEMKATTDSGTTMSSIFVHWEGGSEKGVEKDARQVRVFCANIGDSRCVMLKSYDIKSALVSSNPSRTNSPPPLKDQGKEGKNKTASSNKKEKSSSNANR